MANTVINTSRSAPYQVTQQPGTAAGNYPYEVPIPEENTTRQPRRHHQSSGTCNSANCSDCFALYCCCLCTWMCCDTDSNGGNCCNCDGCDDCNGCDSGDCDCGDCDCGGCVC